MTPIKQRRLLAIEREVRLQRKQFDEVLKLTAQNAVLAGVNRRLLGENDALRRNVDALKQHIEALSQRKAA